MHADSTSSLRFRRRWYPILVLLVTVLLATTSVAAADGASPTPGTKSVLRIGWLENPDNLNPFVSITASACEIYRLNYDFLVGYDAATLLPKPEFAQSWSHSPDGLVWTFKIRPGMKWQDGQPATARDVAFTFNYIIKNNLTNFTSYTDTIVRVEAPNDTTAVFYCSKPKANILAMWVPIVPEHIWSKVSPKAAANSFRNNPPIIGSGPFQTVEVKKSQYVRMVANKTYWRGAPKIDEIIFELYTNADSMATDLKLGNLDGAVGMQAAQFKSLRTASGITVNQGAATTFTELGMNCYDSPNSKGNPVLLDQRFREALNWAVDRKKIVDLAFTGLATVGSSISLPGSPWRWEPPADQAFTYDPEKAKAILDEAGYKDINGDGYRDTKDGKQLTLRLLATTDIREDQMAGVLITGFLKNIGIRVKYSVVDSGVLLNAQYNYEGKTYAPDYDLYVWVWTSDVDPNWPLSIYTPQQIEGYNDCLWTDPVYTKLFTQQSQELDPQKRLEIVYKMQEIFYKGAAYAVLAYPFQLEAYNTAKWEGWSKSPAKAGSVVENLFNIDNYLNVKPRIAEVKGGGLSAGTIAGIVIAAAAVAAGAAVLVVRMRRRGGRAEEA